MADFIGTTDSDTLTGTAGDDLLKPLGTTEPQGLEELDGGDGADVYDLSRSADAGIYNFLINDSGTDGAIDTIVGVGALYQSANLGYQGWATFERVGGDLVIHLPHRPYYFRHPGAPSYDIVISDQWGDGTITTMTAGGTLYNLITGRDGTTEADILTGGDKRSRLNGDAGDDYLYGNGGRDRLDGGDGDDVLFGGNRADVLLGGSGTDRMFGGNGNDKIRGGADGDFIYGENGRDKVWAGAGADFVRGHDGNDTLRGQNGKDNLDGGADDDLLIGGKGGDLYTFYVDTDGAASGHDRIRDAGNKATYLNADIIEINGIYGPSSPVGLDGAFAMLDFARIGNDLLIEIGTNADSTITVENMFHEDANRWFVEYLELGAGYWSSIRFWFVDGAVSNIGDDRDHDSGLYTGAVNEVLVGTDADDLIYGDAGHNFIWTGAGADTLIYKENDGGSFGAYGGGISHDIVLDFDPLLDTLDFSEMKLAGLSSLTLGEDEDGDATIYWDSGTWEVADVSIELRNVSLDMLDADNFIF